MRGGPILMAPSSAVTSLQPGRLHCAQHIPTIRPIRRPRKYSRLSNLPTPGPPQDPETAAAKAANAAAAGAVAAAAAAPAMRGRQKRCRCCTDRPCSSNTRAAADPEKSLRLVPAPTGVSARYHSPGSVQRLPCCGEGRMPRRIRNA